MVPPAEPNLTQFKSLLRPTGDRRLIGFLCIKGTLILKAMANWAAIALMLVSSYSLALDSVSFRNCKKLIIHANKKISRSFLRPEAKTEISRILRSRSKNKEKEIFEIVLKERLAIVPNPFPSAGSGLSARVMDLLKNRRRTRPSRQISAVYTQANHWGASDNSIEILLPEYLIGSPLEYAMALHEVEHAIQQGTTFDQSIAQFPNDLRQYRPTERNWADEEYQREVGAMLVEFEYLNIFPKKQRMELVRKIKADPHLSDEAKKDFSLILGFDAALNPYELVTLMHANGIYSRQYIKEMQREHEDEMLRRYGL